MGKYNECLFLVLLFLFFGGCGTRKQSRTQEKTTTDSAWQRRDTIGWQQLVERQGRRKVEMTMVRLMAPDTAGRQYVESVVEVRTVENTVETLDSQAEAKTMTTASLKQEVEREERRDQQRQTGKGWGFWIGWIGVWIGAVVGGWIFFKRLRK